MEEFKKDSEILAEIYRNAQLALTSISDILPEIDDESIKEEILREHEEYEKSVRRRRLSLTNTTSNSKNPVPLKRR